MKLPRDLDGEELSRLLSIYGYNITRQTGSHIRLSTSSIEPNTTLLFPDIVR
jgi:predicted RNA binding protein YcfA (HicA-like mRNA interferase family)